MKTLSIITINYNNYFGLKRTIQSVINQSFNKYEYIIIDGGSTDGSLEIIKESANVSKWLSEKDNGIYDAMNKGISLVSCDYVLFLNSGDELANNNVILNISQYLGNEDIVYGNMLIVVSNEVINQGKMPDKLSLDHMIADTLWHPVSFIKTDLFEKIGKYDTKYKIVADYHWFLKALFNFNITYKHINENISKFYLGGISSEANNHDKLKIERREAQIEVLGENKVDRFYQKKRKKEKNLFYRILKKIMR